MCAYISPSDVRQATPLPIPTVRTCSAADPYCLFLSFTHQSFLSLPLCTLSSSPFPLLSAYELEQVLSSLLNRKEKPHHLPLPLQVILYNT